MIRFFYSLTPPSLKKSEKKRKRSLLPTRILIKILSIVTITTKNNTFEYNDGDGTLFAKSNQTVKIVLEIKSCAMLLVLLLPLLVLF